MARPLTMARIGFGLGLLLMSTLGAAFGQLLTSKPARATSCVTPTWHVALVSVSSTNPDVQHAGFWPQRSRLHAYKGHAHIETQSHEPGVVSRAGAGR